MGMSKFLIICQCLILILPSIAICQNHYSIVGNSNEIRWIIRIEVVDSESNAPIKDAKIVLTEIPSRTQILNLRTNGDGVGVILVKEIKYIPGVGTLKIVAPGYRYWEKEIQQWDFIQEEKNRKVYLTNINPRTWTDLNNIPNDREIIREIENRNFKIWDDYNTVYYAPGIFEFNVEMEKIPKKIDVSE